MTTERVWRAGRPIPLLRMLADLRRGPGDPTMVWQREGAAVRVWRTALTPQGPATLRLETMNETEGAIAAQAWGSGAEWVLEQLPRLLGEADDPGQWQWLQAAAHPVVGEAVRQCGHVRLPRTDLLLEAVVAAVLEQRVTGGEAWRAWRVLVRRYGTSAPGGPAGQVPEQLRVIPGPQVWRQIPSWQWHQAGVDPARAACVMRVLALPAWRRGNSTGDPVTVGQLAWNAALATIPGVGAWTLAEMNQRCWGDPDAISVGDYHLPTIIGWALGEGPTDDAGMLELLAPYAGQRHRVGWLLRQAGHRRPRFAPRYQPHDFRRM